MVTGITSSQGLETVLCHSECIYVRSKHLSVPVCVLGRGQGWTERSQLQRWATAGSGASLWARESASGLLDWSCWGPGWSPMEISPKKELPQGFGDGDASRHQKKTSQDFSSLESSTFDGKPRPLGESASCINYAPTRRWIYCHKLGVFCTKGSDKREMCSIAVRWVFALNRALCLGENLQFFPPAVVGAAGGNNTSVWGRKM